MKILKSIIITLFVAVLFTLTSCQTTSKIADEPKVPEEKKLNYRMITITEDTEYLDADIVYPEFYDIPQLSNIVKNSVLNQYGYFKKSAQKEWYELKKERESSGENKFPPFGYEVKSSVYGNERYQSVLLETYNFTGGAHGYTSLITFTFDKNDKVFVNIIDATGLSYKQLSQLCNSELKNKFKKMDPGLSINEIEEWINEGTFPTADNYEIFTIDGKTVTVYFEAYKVAPYAFGDQKVIIPIKK